MNPAPAFQLYPRDILAAQAIELMLPEARGGYFMLMLHAWNPLDGAAPGYLPNDPLMLAALSRLGVDGWARCSASILRGFIIEGDHLRLDWMADYAVELETYRAESAAAGKRGGEKRWERERQRRLEDSREATTPPSGDPNRDTNTSVSASASSSASATATATEIEDRKKPPANAGDQAPNGAGGDVDAQGSLSGFSQQRRKKPEAKTGRKKADPADVAKLITHYTTEWIRIRKPPDGKPPTLTKADRGQAAALASNPGVEQAMAWIDRYLADDDTFLGKRGYALADLASRINGYRANSTPATSRGFAEPCEAQPETKKAFR